MGPMDRQPSRRSLFPQAASISIFLDLSSSTVRIKIRVMRRGMKPPLLYCTPLPKRFWRCTTLRGIAAITGH